MNKIKLIAHRGYSFEHRENSWEAIKAAIELGYNGVEIDVQPCASGELCLHHDLYVDDSFICDMSVDEIREKGICFLRDIYDKIHHSVHLYIDIKGGNAEAVVEFFRDKVHDHVTFCSFNRQILRALPSNMKKGTTFEMIPGGVYEYDILTEGMDAVLIHWSCLNEEFIGYCRTKGIEVLTYTHKTMMDLRYICHFKLDGIITDGLKNTDA